MVCIIDLSKIIQKIRPGKEQEIQVKKVASEIIAYLNKKIKDAKAELGGSGARGTNLRSFDIDIFVKFNYEKYKDNNKISSILEKALKKYKPERIKGSRDYFHIKKEKFTLEIVPILDVKKAEQALNITDVSPLHTRYVNKNLKKKDDVRLLKQFLKSAKIYGAESHVKGFSGYVCELLVIYYGSFEKVLRAVSKWRERETIDIGKFYKGKDVEMELNESKRVSPLILIDPVQKDRNAAAAISKESYKKFILRAKEYLKEPSESFFKEEIPDIEALSKNHVVVKASASGKHDIAGAKLLKTFQHLLRKAEEYGFKIKSKDWHYNANKALFWISADDVDKKRIVEGPPVRFKVHAEKFRRKHRKTFEKNKRLYAEVNRKHTKLRDFIEESVKESYVKERTRKVEVL